MKITAECWHQCRCQNQASSLADQAFVVSYRLHMLWQTWKHIWGDWGGLPHKNAQSSVIPHAGAYDKPSVLHNATTGCNLLPTCWIHVPKWSFKRNGQRSRYSRTQTPTSDEPSKPHRLRFASRSTQFKQEITRESHYSYRQPISLQPWSSLKTSRQTGTTKINK
jgi:hypothetical protein